MESLNQILTSLLPPAIIVSVVAYLIRFFGKIISDQKPFADNRGWEIELSGLTFFLGVILFPGILGAIGAIYLGDLSVGHWVRLIAIILIGSWFLLTDIVMGDDLYKTKTPFVELLAKISGQSNKDADEFRTFFAKAGKHTPLWLLVIILAYALICEYLGGDIAWLAISSIFTFLNLTFIALGYSLQQLKKLPEVDIYLIGASEPLRGLTLLKVNDDNVRLRDGNNIVILNKSQVLKLEMNAVQGAVSSK